MTTISEPRAPVEVAVQPAITVDRLTKRYGDSNDVDDVSFSVPYAAEAMHAHGPLGGRKRTWIVAAVLGGLTQVGVGFLTVIAIGLVGVPLWAAVVLVGTWLAAAAIFARTVRHAPLTAALVPVAHGLLVWAVIAAGETWLGWSG